MKRRDFLKGLACVIPCSSLLGKAKPKVALDPEHPKRVANIERLKHKTPSTYTCEERMKSRQEFLQANNICFVGGYHGGKGLWESTITGQRYDATDYGIIYGFAPDGKINEEYFLTEWIRIPC